LSRAAHITIDKVVRFHHLLISTPELAREIRKLQVEVFTTTGIIKSESEYLADIARVKEWFASSTVLADIFEMLPCLERLDLADVAWDGLSSQLKSASVKLFQFSGLITIRLDSFHGLPLCSLHLSPVKHLLLYDVQPLGGNSTQIVLPQLETLLI
jgi:hypothetical protein